jgi:hypothetical protein
VEKKAFLLRIDRELWETLEKWAADEFRSINGHIEFLLDRCVREAGRRRPLARSPSPPKIQKP